MNDRILFILKSRESDWGGYTCHSGYVSSGLANSVRFLAEMLLGLNIEAKIVEVADNNGIDAAVTAWRPTHVVIEAFWVVPEKFDVLKPLHPSVTWIVRNHSEVPFLANEGIAFGWIAGYLKRGVEVMCNAPRAMQDVRALAAAYGFSDRLVTYGPNYYPSGQCSTQAAVPNRGKVANIGCFGAIRPLKNHVAQALAAIEFARRVNVKLRFHINATRIEGGADPVLKNLRQLFTATPGHELIEHGWMAHEEFLHLIATMDIALQVSFSETFNIVAADAAVMNVPVVVSSELPWIGDYAHADPSNTRAIAKAMIRLWQTQDLTRLLRQQRLDLSEYGARTKTVWRERFVAQDVLA